MKKGWKILLISCGICAGIGVVLSVAGTVLGGVRDLQEYGRRGMQYLENDHWWSQKYSKLDHIDEEASPEITEDLEGISELDIELSYVELIMERSDSNQIEVSTRNMDPQLLEDLSIYRDENTLEIRAQDTRPVSYTHLDVYKRQVCRGVGSGSYDDRDYGKGRDV